MGRDYFGMADDPNWGFWAARCGYCHAARNSRKASSGTSDLKGTCRLETLARESARALSRIGAEGAVAPSVQTRPRAFLAPRAWLRAHRQQRRSISAMVKRTIRLAVCAPASAAMADIAATCSAFGPRLSGRPLPHHAHGESRRCTAALLCQLIIKIANAGGDAEALSRAQTVGKWGSMCFTIYVTWLDRRLWSSWCWRSLSSGSPTPAFPDHR